MNDQEIAYLLAPVIAQKVNKDNPRGDFITRIDFTDPGNLRSLIGNWSATHAPISEEDEWRDIQNGAQQSRPGVGAIAKTHTPPENWHSGQPILPITIWEGFGSLVSSIFGIII